jgi:hypothetical protein
VRLVVTDSPEPTMLKLHDQSVASLTPEVATLPGQRRCRAELSRSGVRFALGPFRARRPAQPALDRPWEGARIPECPHHAGRIVEGLNA